MSSTFRLESELAVEHLEWGSFRWISNSSQTGAGQITALSADVAPGKSHGFHRHPDQEEVIYVLAGTIEQWIGDEKRNLRTGDAVFIPTDMVHGTYNVGDETARLLVVFSPCRGGGFEAVDMTGEAPWNRLRT